MRRYRERLTAILYHVDHLRLIRLSAIGDEPPVEFRIFAAGVNESSKGPCIFDDDAARSVMATYEREGIDLMLDLEHAAVSGGSTDALAWYQLAVRSSELWAVNVRWTPEGEARLLEKRQRYISPAFMVDENDRVTHVINCALTSLPATYHAPALVAASKRYTTSRRLSKMNVEIVKKALDALTSGDSDAAMAILQELIASAAAGEEPSAPAEDGEALADPPADEPEESEEIEERDAPAATPGCPTPVIQHDMPTREEIATWRASHIELEKRTAALEAERKRLEDADRSKLVTELIRLGAETPATARTNGKLVARLANEPIASIKLRVAALAKARPAAPEAPRTASHTDLSESALRVYNSLQDDAAKQRFLTNHRKLNPTREARS